MGLVKYITPLWIALLFYAVSSFFWGGVGLSAYKQLGGEYEKQLKNIAELRNIGASLGAEKAALSNDGDTIIAYSRNLGYGSENERFVRIVGFKGFPKQITESGDVYKITRPFFIEDKNLRVISLIIFVSMFICIFIIDVLNFIRRI